MYSENQVRSLRKLYHKTLWTHVGVATLLVAYFFATCKLFLLYRVGKRTVVDEFFVGKSIILRRVEHVR